MYCPRTKEALKAVRFADLQVFVSPSGGVFFDNNQIYQFSDPGTQPAQALVSHLQAMPEALINHSARINCPICPNIVMMRRFFTPVKAVEIDECPQCAGIWLDHGELEKIHVNHLTPAQRALLRTEMANNHGYINITPPVGRFHLKESSLPRSKVERLVELAILSMM